MEDGFELLTGDGIDEDAMSEFVASEGSVPGEDLGTKKLADFCKSRLAGFHDLAREDISVDNRNASFLEQVGTRGFPHANAAG